MAKAKIPEDKKQLIDNNLKVIFEALEEKGYDPVSQILGYIFTGDPTYMTTHKNARILMSELDNEEIARHVLEVYFNL